MQNNDLEINEETLKIWENLKKKPKDLDSFLNYWKCKKGERPSHARIPCHAMNIRGGSFNIHPTALPLFYKLYNKKVFRDKIKDYLVETQNRKNGGPILIDFDFKFSKETKIKQWTSEHDADIVELIAEKLYDMCEFQDGEILSISIFKKDSIDLTNDKYMKEGIHIHIGGIMNHFGQMFLRDKILQVIDEQLFEDLDLINNKTEIYDNHITNGGGQWQVYGSRKSPNHSVYKLKAIYTCVYSEENAGFTQSVVEKADFPKLVDRSKLFSTRNKDWNEFVYKETIKKSMENKKNKKLPNTTNNVGVVNKTIMNFNMFIQNDMVNSLKNEKDLDDTIHIMLNSVNNMNHIVKQAHQYVMLLDENYYDCFEKWIRVGWSLKNTDPILILTWIKFSLKSDKCYWSDVSLRIDEWNRMSSTGGLTIGSIIHWAKECDLQASEGIYNSSMSYYINRCLKSKSYNNEKHAIAEWDLGMVAKHMFGTNYVCTDIKNNRWYEFINNRWIASDSGTTLRTSLSQVLSRVFSEEERKVTAKIKNKQYEIGQEKEIMSNAAIFNKIAITLRKTSEKNNIMRECRDIFYDKNLINKLDVNPYTVCFNNGIYDLESNEFRKGRPEDYISLCTNIDYIKINYSNRDHVKIIELINDFMEKVFPNSELREYMWDHLSSGFVGHNKNQTFNIYTGCGRNGKSKAVELMEMCLGDYKASCPITLITSKRSSIGASSAEIAKLKGKRYVVMQEPSKGDVINEGIMKEITGDDVIEARELYCNPIQFRPMFTFVCCTNNLFSIKSNDDGTWRRIRKVPFESKFIKPGDKDYPPSDVPDDKEYECDLDLPEKLKEWKEIFASMLIERAVKTLGKVKDCATVMAASNEYRNSQDYLMKFFNEKIVDGLPSDKISKHNIFIEFKEWWKIENPSEKIPPSNELTEFLNIKCGKYKKRGWWGWKIVYEGYDDEDE
jgi:P4 family phage/plasmid primase-like protien